ncbi:MAG: hypothetical protein Q4G24_08150 [Paracoccus sp. (in: a-proteobacteria)]|uniref:hypothetical protein n=1 Tax=Paracoccus sp. TaxID=267 RepID=UPI0026E02C2B|nr:hypothetical protein [Paracoccus sp. (in: a-proteobacteria)]MDO5621425.1 hypothetical protein [Paracoccus sp. (in: a-proteobacteria)]
MTRLRDNGNLTGKYKLDPALKLTLRLLITVWILLGAAMLGPRPDFTPAPSHSSISVLELGQKAIEARSLNLRLSLARWDGDSGPAILPDWPVPIQQSPAPRRVAALPLQPRAGPLAFVRPLTRGPPLNV